MNGSKLLASSDELGRIAIFSGFSGEDLAAFCHDWGLDLTNVPEPGAGDYCIVREPWSEAAGTLRSQRAAEGDELVRVDCGEEDALLGRAGVLWLSPGRRAARIALERAIDPGSDDLAAFPGLVGAALMHALSLAGKLSLHGMAAEVDGIGVLALGDSMSGKSTLALAILHAGGRLVSDDFLLADSVVERPRLRALRRDLSIRAGSFGLIPGPLRTQFVDEGGGSSRAVLRRDAAPECFVGEVNPQVVWFLDGTVRPQESRVARMTQAEALSGLLRLGSPLFLSHRYGVERAALLPRLLQTVQSIPCFRVELGPDLLRSPAFVVRTLIQRPAR